jgi:hypothetical protein
VTARVTLRDVPRLVNAHLPFNANGSLRGVRGAHSGTGQLPSPHYEVWERHRRQRAVAYTVVSYDTPIAWVLHDGRVFAPPVKYSVTTSRHQSKVPLRMEVDAA